MNTKHMFQVAQSSRLSDDEARSLIMWALVSQQGRKEMTVGQVCKIVSLISNKSISKSMARRVLSKWADEGFVYRTNMRRTGVAMVVGYSSGECGVLWLAAMRAHLWDHKEVYAAITAATEGIVRAAIDAANKIYNFNQETDGVA